MNPANILSIRAFGGLDIKLNGERIAESSDSRRGILLVYLADQGETHARKTIARSLWPHADDDAALSNLRTLLTRMRQEGLEPYLEADRFTLRMRPGMPVDYDVGRFRRALRTPGSVSIPDMAAALELFSGPFLQDALVQNSPELEEWASRIQREAEHLATAGWYHLTQRYLDAGLTADAIQAGLRLLEFAPYDDDAHALYMRALVADSRPAEALHHYEVYHRSVRTEFGLDSVSPALTALAKELRTGLQPDTRQGQAPQEIAQAAPSPLPATQADPKPSPIMPVPAQRLFGRAAELAQLQAWISSEHSRLLSIVGLGGVGKTRLAIALAQAVETQFADGVWYVDLAGEDTSMAGHAGAPDICRNIVARAIGRTLGLVFMGDQPIHAQLFFLLAGKQLCLVLDNFEDLLPATAYLGELIQHAPQCTLVVTSRVRLNLASEHLCVLRGLSLPESAELSSLAQSEAVQLFLNAARRRLPRFELTEQTAQAMVDICRLTGGLPLALLMVASWIEHFRIDEIPEQLVDDIAYLSTDVRDIPARQRDLSSVLAWTWRQLDPDIQSRLAALSVFADPFSRAAAEAVVAATASDLATLVRHALLEMEQPGWYRIHPLIREFAARESESIEGEGPRQTACSGTRHAEFYGTRLLRWESIDRASMRLLYPNLNRALSWYAAHQPAWIVENLDCLHAFWIEFGFFADAYALLARLPAAVGNDPYSTARVFAKLGKYAQLQQDSTAALHYLERARDLFLKVDAPVELADVYEDIGWVNYDQADRIPLAYDSFRLSLEQRQKAGDMSRTAFLHNAMGRSCHWRDLELAEHHFDAAEAVARAQGDHYSLMANAVGHLRVAVCRNDLEAMVRYYPVLRQWAEEEHPVHREAWIKFAVCEHAVILGYLDDAQHYLDESQALLETLHAELSLLKCLKARADLFVQQQNWSSAIGAYRTCLMRAFERPEKTPVIAQVLLELAGPALDKENVAAATFLLGAAQSFGVQTPAAFCRIHRKNLAALTDAVRARQSQSDFDRHWNLGQSADNHTILDRAFRPWE